MSTAKSPSVNAYCQYLAGYYRELRYQEAQGTHWEPSKELNQLMASCRRSKTTDGTNELLVDIDTFEALGEVALIPVSTFAPVALFIGRQ